MNSSTELSTGFRGNRWRVGMPDLRMCREGLKPTVDINAVEPNVPRDRNSVLQRTERRGQNHVLGEFGASTARYEVFLVETELHSSLVFLELDSVFMICLWEEKRRGGEAVSALSLVPATQTKSYVKCSFGQHKGKVVVTQILFLMW